MLTNVSKRGRPPKAVKVVQQAPQDSEIEIEGIEVQENIEIEDDVNDNDSVEDMIEIDRKEE